MTAKPLAASGARHGFALKRLLLAATKRGMGDASAVQGAAIR